jgi:hypothetical protein
LAKIDVTPEQERELKSKGYAVKPVTDVVSNRRSYWDPRKDEEGNVMGWTLPLPGDTARMNFYLRKGFKLEDPEGNLGPPPGYFRRNLTPMLAPTKAPEVGVGSGEIVQKSAGTTPILRCPICQKDFPDTDTLVHHMIYHRSRAKKVKAKKSKRGKSGVKNSKGG